MVFVGTFWVLPTLQMERAVVLANRLAPCLEAERSIGQKVLIDVSASQSSLPRKGSGKFPQLLIPVSGLASLN